MTALVHAQWVGLRTLRSSWVVPTVLILSVMAFVWGGLAKVGEANLTTADQISDVLLATVGLLTAVTLAVFAAMRTAGEYRHDTITQRILASPNRMRMLAAVLFTYATVGLVVMSAALVGGIFVALLLIAGKDLSLGLSADVVATTVLAGVLFTLLGALAGFIWRSQPAALTAVIGLFFAEQILADLTGDVGHYLPYALIRPLLGDSEADVSAGAAALSLTAITVGLAILASVLLKRRDVT